MARNFDPVTKVIIEGENRVLAHFKAIEAEAKKTSDRLKAQFSEVFKQAAKEWEQTYSKAGSQSRKTGTGRGKSGLMGGLFGDLDSKKVKSEIAGVTKHFEEAAEAARSFSQGDRKGQGGSQKRFSGLVERLGKAGLALSGLQMGFEAALSVGQQFYGGLIGANEQLNQEILGSAANLAATSRILKNGIEITSPTEQIEQLQGPLRDALKQIAEDSIDLVGVTSQELTGVFATLNAQAAQLTGQSKEFTNAIDAAGKLTIDFSAALGTIGLPLNQAGQEIRSILQGTIDMNSTLAKQLGLTNDMVKRWKSQGVLVDELRKKLQPFVEGNALAAQSIGGVKSNILDVLQIMQRDLGEPLTEPIVKGLQEVYEWVTQNQEEIKNLIEPFLIAGLEASKAFAQNLMPVLEQSWETLQDIQPAALKLFQLLGAGFAASADLAAPFVNRLLEMVSALAQAVDFASSIVLASQISDAQDALDAYQRSIDTIADSYRTNISQAQELREKEKEGIELTKEELELQQMLREQGDQGIAELDAQIEQLRLLRSSTPEESESIDALIKQAESLKKTLNLSGATSEFGLLGQEIQDRGNDFQQLAKSAEGALDQLNQLSTQGGDSVQLQDAAKRLVDVVQQQVQAGAISREQANEQLMQVRENAKVEVATRQQAAAAIAKINESATQQRVNLINAEIAEVEVAVLEGSKTEVQAAQETTRLKVKQLEIQLEAVRAAIEAERRLRREMIQEQLADLDTQIAAAQQAVAAATTGQESQAAQAQVEALQSQRENVAASINLQSEKEQQLIQQEQQLQANLKKVVIEGEREILQAQLREIEQATSKLNDEIRLAATERELAMQQAINANPGMDPLDRAEEELKAQRQRLDAELKAEQEHLAQLQALPEPRNPQDREALEQQIRASIQKTADLTLELSRQEEREQRAAIERVQTDLQRQLSARLNALTAERQVLEGHLQTYQQISDQMARELDLLNQQIDARKEYDDITQGYYDVAIKFAKDEEEAQKLQEEAQERKIAQLEKQQELERLQLELKLEQNKAALEQEMIQARIQQLQSRAAQAQAEADYAIAAADPSTRPEQLEALRLNIVAAQMQGGAADLALVSSQEQLQRFEGTASLERQSLRDRQDAELFNERANLASLTETERDDRRIRQEALDRARGRSSDYLNEGIENSEQSFRDLNAQLQEFSTGLSGLTPAPGVSQPAMALSTPGVIQAPQVAVPSMALSPSQVASLPQSGGQAGAPMAGMGGQKIINFEPVINNTFTGSGQPDRQAVKDFENGTLGILKGVLELI
ncbi:MAG: hypothetical protein F6K42_00590 [Leptolyngbya sp. SIO1D8]|nr:hypothetical protein [Leptolyngbya sp. SIO1D8]